MRFFQVVLSGAALIAAAWAVELNDVPSKIESGKTYTITYSPKDNTPTTLKLRKGDPGNLDTIATLTTSATGGSFEWTVDASLPNGDDYAIEIDQEGADPNFSGLITLTGSDAEASSSGSATPSATAASSTAKESSTDASTTAAETTLITSTAASTAASATITSTAGTNSTISSATLSRTGTSSPSSTTTGNSSPPQETNAASVLGSSPFALIFGAIAAMAYLN